jgi:hypothetical protein
MPSGSRPSWPSSWQRSTPPWRDPTRARRRSGRRPQGVTQGGERHRFEPGWRGGAAPLFAELDALAAQYGPTRTERRWGSTEAREHRSPVYIEVCANDENGSKSDRRIGAPTTFLPIGISSSARATPPPTHPPLSATGTSAPAEMISPTTMWRDPRRNLALEHWLADGMAGGSKKTAQQELEEAQVVVKELTMELAKLDAALDPSREREQEIRHAIKLALRNVGGVIHLDMARAAERKPLFAELDALSAQYGRTRTERRRVNTEASEHRSPVYIEVPSANPPMGSKSHRRIGGKRLPTMILPKGISSSASAAPPPTPPALAATGTSTPAATIPPTFLKDRRNRALEHWFADGMAGGSKKTAEQELEEAQVVVKELTMELARMDVLLDPVREQEQWLRHEIKLTHRNVDGVIAGKAHLDGVDALAAEMERKWGCDRLRLLVAADLREKFDRQRYFLNQAISCV